MSESLCSLSVWRVAWNATWQLVERPWAKVAALVPPAAGVVIGGVLGNWLPLLATVAVFALVFLWNLLRAPYRQRDEALKYIQGLQQQWNEEELERALLSARADPQHADMRALRVLFERGDLTPEDYRRFESEVIEHAHRCASRYRIPIDLVRKSVELHEARDKLMLGTKKARRPEEQ